MTGRRKRKKNPKESNGKSKRGGSHWKSAVAHTTFGATVKK